TVVSRLNQMKGLEQFLEAAAILAPRFPRVYFVVVGEPTVGDQNYKPSLERLAARLGIEDRVVFTGLRADVPPRLASAAGSAGPAVRALGATSTAASVEVFSDPALCYAMEAEWDVAVARAGFEPAGLRPEWRRTWWECFGAGRRLHSIGDGRAREFVAVAPT